MKTINSCLVFLGLVILNESSQLSPVPRPSDRLLRFLSVFCGYFQGLGFHYPDDRADRVRQTYQLTKFTEPVLVPALFPSPTFYYEEMYGDKIADRGLFSVWEDGEGKIRARYFNFNGVIRPADLSLEYLQSLTRDDLSTTNRECDLVVSQVSETVFYGYWPECSWAESGLIPHFDSFWSCDGVNSTFYDVPPWNETELESFSLKRYKSGPALLPYMLEGVDDYTDACETNHDQTRDGDQLGHDDQPGDDDRGRRYVKKQTGDKQEKRNENDQSSQHDNDTYQVGQNEREHYDRTEGNQGGHTGHDQKGQSEDGERGDGPEDQNRDDEHDEKNNK